MGVITHILPLSALLEFLDIPRTPHAFELNDAVSLWCWPITPTSDRPIQSKHATEEFDFSGFMPCHLSLAFLIDVPTTGGPCLPYLYVVATLQMNKAEWLAFYGEIVLVNSLLNHRG
ncbi:uncharacterized protein F4807DRAFT_236977 [Annulohypoxylon truncatum]|uniref:uncharacterized protein n=1 Tax=Annulohypoxylon truncatum TaxID=327061 RepID=UPI0020077232|nr:uncharacterized protein F4807DRAFT_236977 [Annulohypoxylon truncatum]KAI1206345.1 hypothetical protein F4807DRAFT_236977 [Annulohypoxylon truncatum]